MNCYVTEKNLTQKTRQWLRRIAPFNQHNMKLQKPKSALLVIDMQDFFLDPNSPTFICGGLAILRKMEKLIHIFRTANRPVIYTCHVHHPQKLDAGIMGWWWKGMCIEGTEDSKIHKRLSPRTNEKIIYKHRYSSFYNTDLETVLRCMKIQDLVISGIMTNMCCESTARDAYYRDYKTFFLADATGSINEQMHLATLLNLAFGFSYITTTKDIIKQLV